VLSIVIFMFYPLSEKRMAEINADLNARRNSRPATTT
jgi:Na+/melibiose symporter-like transporter